MNVLLAAHDLASEAIWSRMPLYCQYIVQTDLQDERRQMLQGLQGFRGSRVTVEAAAESPSPLECTTLFPSAVAAESMAKLSSTSRGSCSSHVTQYRIKDVGWDTKW